MYSQAYELQHQNIRTASHGSVLSTSSASSSSAGSTSSVRSRSIPIHGSSSQSYPLSRRTPSEEQLCLDEALADTRDYRFCCRVVNGISRTIERNESSSSPHWRDVNQACLDHIINTRNNTNKDVSMDRVNVVSDRSYSSRSPSHNVNMGGFMMQGVVSNSADVDDDWAMGYCDIDNNDDESDDDEYGTFSLNRNDPITVSAINWLKANSSDEEDEGVAGYEQDSRPSYEDEIIFDMD